MKPHPRVNSQKGEPALSSCKCKQMTYATKGEIRGCGLVAQCYLPALYHGEQHSSHYMVGGKPERRALGRAFGGLREDQQLNPGWCDSSAVFPSL